MTPPGPAPDWRDSSAAVALFRQVTRDSALVDAGARLLRACRRVDAACAAAIDAYDDRAAVSRLVHLAGRSQLVARAERAAGAVGRAWRGSTAGSACGGLATEFAALEAVARVRLVLAACAVATVLHAVGVLLWSPPPHPVDIAIALLAILTVAAAWAAAPLLARALARAAR
ncbi:MAG: hypothetical protein AB7H88_04155 [Vicinamibacterales bacterium]